MGRGAGAVNAPLGFSAIFVALAADEQDVAKDQVAVAPAPFALFVGVDFEHSAPPVEQRFKPGNDTFAHDASSPSVLSARTTSPMVYAVAPLSPVKVLSARTADPDPAVNPVVVPTVLY